MTKLEVTHDYGFFSNCSMALWQLNNFITANRFNPELDMSQSFSLYKDSNSDINVYDLCFDQSLAEEVITPFEFSPSEEDGNLHLKRTEADGTKVLRSHVFYMAHRMYKPEFIKSALPIANRYFAPSEYVLKLKDQYIQKYSINTAQTLAICYRGTDKHLEVPVLSFDTYTNGAEEILNSNKHLDTVLVQSDQSQFVDFCKSKFSNFNVVKIDEIPTTDSGKQISYTTNKKQDLATNFLASLLIMSECNYVVTHTGNVGMWLVLYRGHCDNIRQYFLV